MYSTMSAKQVEVLWQVVESLCHQYFLGYIRFEQVITKLICTSFSLKRLMDLDDSFVNSLKIEGYDISCVWHSSEAQRIPRGQTTPVIVSYAYSASVLMLCSMLQNIFFSRSSLLLYFQMYAKTSCHPPHPKITVHLTTRMRKSCH